MAAGNPYNELLMPSNSKGKAAQFLLGIGISGQLRGS
jgi:hypothetical protein